ncbi:hypothetical protein [Halomarina oriensis]|uniref:Uncharacterized protein n=1 Tax=Halomarina oriensis TaxID=671145 RepID=A0A6B0GR08_9EURY|nr:hypothetical protein [Halomarina oriensis]MWG36521.1 hypothetical protein [Halomarina oriensis]
MSIRDIFRAFDAQWTAANRHMMAEGHSVSAYTVLDSYERATAGPLVRLARWLGVGGR